MRGIQNGQSRFKKRKIKTISVLHLIYFYYFYIEKRFCCLALPRLTHSRTSLLCCRFVAMKRSLRSCIDSFIPWLIHTIDFAGKWWCTYREKAEQLESCCSNPRLFYLVPGTLSFFRKIEAKSKASVAYNVHATHWWEVEYFVSFLLFRTGG